MQSKRLLLCGAVVAAPLVLSACYVDEFELQLLHVADIDGQPEALSNVDNFSALVDYYRAQAPDNTLFLSSGDNYIPGPRYFAASAETGEIVDLLGVPGNGRGDIAFLNAMGLAASAVGNHDLDEGTAAFADLIAPETVDGRQWEGAQFPYLSTNLDFTTDANLSPLAVADGQETDAIPGFLAGSAVYSFPDRSFERGHKVITIDGQRIGLVGASTPGLGAITSTGDITVKPDSGLIDDLAAQIQTAVDALHAQGINKIILLAHMQQLSIERELAQRLRHVDIIIGGGSNTILADGDDALRAGDTPADTYPLQYRSPRGEPVLVVNVDGDYRYLGRLNVTFNPAGRIKLHELDSLENGPIATTDAQVAAVGATPIPRVAEISAALRDVLLARDGNILGRTQVYLDGRRSQVRTEETNMGNLTADANLWYARQYDPGVDVSLKNGGGIRADIGERFVPAGSTTGDPVEEPPAANPATGKRAGEISQFDIEGTLRFNNGLTLLTVTAGELCDIVEHAVAGTAPGATPGQFPQVGGMRFSFDPDGAARPVDATNTGDCGAGGRLEDLVIVDAGGAVVEQVVDDGTVTPAAAGKTYRLVTLGFLAGGGDDYPFQGLAAPGRVDLETVSGTDPGQADFAPAGSEQDALAEFLEATWPGTPGVALADDEAAFDAAETEPAADERIQNLNERASSL